MALWTFDSTNVKGIEYRRELQILIVHLHNKRIYEYAAVPPEVNQAFRDAASPGKFYANEIKGKYTPRRIDDGA